MSALATTLQAFFTDRLVRQRQVSCYCRVPAKRLHTGLASLR